MRHRSETPSSCSVDLGKKELAKIVNLENNSDGSHPPFAKIIEEM